MASKYDEVYNKHIDSVIHMLSEVEETGSSTIELPEIAAVGGRESSGYKGRIVFNRTTPVLNGAPAHLVPMMYFCQALMAKRAYAWMKKEILIVTMDRECNMTLRKRSITRTVDNMVTAALAAA